MTAPTGWYLGPSRAPGMAVAVPEPKDDPFYQYDPAQLPGKLPGAVLRHRRTAYHLLGVETALKATQLLYRSTNQAGKPTANVTSIISPLVKPNKTKVISYQSAYDSLNQSDEPSYAISGGDPTLTRIVVDVELAVYGAFLLDGYTVIVPDIEGQEADFAAGPEYGMNTLDSIRAALSSKKVKLPSDAKIAMLGYSGGALATEWAAELAPAYAPDVNKRLIGAAMGGLLVHPAHNLHYVENTWFWGGVMLMALVGIARAFDKEKEFKDCLSDHGVKLFDEMKTKSIINVLGQYGDPLKQTGLKWKDLAKPQYPTPESIPLYVECVNKLIMGTGGDPHGATTPTIPLFIGQGANGELEGTPGNKKGIGHGDGVMIAGDVRTLARSYCNRGNKTIWYEEYKDFSHISSLLLWLPHSIDWIKQRFEDQPAPQHFLTKAIAWIKQRFKGQPAPPAAPSVPQNCSSIPEGNSLDPIPVP